MRTKYYKDYKNYFWQWEEDGEIIAIPNGNTIGYNAHVVSLVSAISSQGLPSFNSILLALIALNPNGKSDLKIVLNILEKNNLLGVNSRIVSGLTFLDRLSNVPDRYKKGELKILLLRSVFKDCHNILSIKKSSILGRNKGGLIIVDFKQRHPVSRSRFYNDFKVFEINESKYPTTDDIILHLGTLPEINEEFNIEGEHDDESKELIEQLQQNQKTHKVGALVKMIWSGINLPFHALVPSQQPIGGVSDLTNKGNFDQLLVSEYANDDLVFLSRLANNEALYLRRESPPSTSDKKRVILIDISLKNWGTPKIVAFATMLAIAKHPKTDIECEVILIGEVVCPIQIDSIHDIVDALQIVDANINCSLGLKEYLTHYSCEDEIIVITEKNATQDASMLKVISDFGEMINYWIYTDSLGKIDLYKNLKRSKKHIQHLELPLKRLWRKKLKGSTIVDSKNMGNYPLLVRIPNNHLGFRKTENGEVFLLTKENSLLRRYNRILKDRNKGWEVFEENIKRVSRDYEVGVLKNGEYVLLLFRRETREIVLFNLSTKKGKIVEFRQWKFCGDQSFFFSDGFFYHRSNTRSWRISTEGVVVDSIKELKETVDLIRKKNSELSHFCAPLPVFRNIKRVGINKNGNLFFNVHELSMKSDTHATLDVFNRSGVITLADPVSRQGYKFKDGSFVEINRLGLIMLKSSDESIPLIHLSSVLQSSIAIATNMEFAGNDYYFVEPQFKISLKGCRLNLSATKAIKVITGFSLKQSKEIVDKIPSNLLIYFNEKQMKEASVLLEQAECDFLIERVNPEFSSLDKVPVKELFDTYIVKFVETIQNYGASS